MVYACANANDEHMLVEPCVMFTNGMAAARSKSMSVNELGDGKVVQLGKLAIARFKYVCSV